ncbi:hypothetical protein ZWY2020_011675 [Hordeum vulgare]|nr:hypothetical protein ZWY2020_011675 [Hordeum vulgare]
MFVGHLGELPLSAASVAASFANVTGFSVLVELREVPEICRGITNHRRQSTGASSGSKFEHWLDHEPAATTCSWGQPAVRWRAASEKGEDGGSNQWLGVECGGELAATCEKRVGEYSAMADPV